MYVEIGRRKELRPVAGIAVFAKVMRNPAELLRRRPQSFIHDYGRSAGRLGLVEDVRTL